MLLIRFQIPPTPYVGHRSTIWKKKGKRHSKIDCGKLTIDQLKEKI